MYRVRTKENRPTERLEVAVSWVLLSGKTIIGLALLIILWAGVFWLISFIWENGYTVGLYASIIGLAIALIGYLLSEPIVVRATNAIRLPDDNPLAKIVARVAKMARMRPPRVYYISTNAINAFATGVCLPIPFFGGRGAIGLTQGIDDEMETDELEAVIAHELTHLKSGDLILATMASALIVTVSLILQVIFRWPRLLGNVRIGSSGSSKRSSSSSRKSKSSGGGSGCGVLLLALAKLLLSILVVVAVVVAVFIITQFIMPLIRGWINRQREYGADAGSAMVMGSPDPLTRALGILKYADTGVKGVGNFSRMFFTADAGPTEDAVDRLFATHPPIDERIAALERRADGHLNLL